MKLNAAYKVLVLGREGLARDQLVNALMDFGVKPLWIGSPAQSNHVLLGELNPNKIIISLEPTIELELEPYGEWLSQPGMTVLYDDAETTRNLSGWDLNRWARHMAAKLLDKDVMPALATVSIADEIDAEYQLETNDASASATESQDMMDSELEFDEISVATDFTNSAETDSFDWQSTEQYEALDINPDELNTALEQLNNTLSAGIDKDNILEMSFEQIKPINESEFSQMDSTPPELKATERLNYSLTDLEDDLGFDDLSVKPNKIEPTDIDMQRMMDEAAMNAAQLDTGMQMPATHNAHASSLELSLVTMDVEHEKPVSEAPVASNIDLSDFDLSKYSLLDDNADKIDRKSVV